MYKCLLYYKPKYMYTSFWLLKSLYWLTSSFFFQKNESSNIESLFQVEEFVLTSSFCFQQLQTNLSSNLVCASRKCFLSVFSSANFILRGPLQKPQLNPTSGA